MPDTEITTYIPSTVETVRLIILNEDGSIQRTIVVHPKTGKVQEIVECVLR